MARAFPYRAVYAAPVSREARLLLAYLWTRSQWWSDEDPIACPSLATICGDLGAPRSTVHRWRSELEEAGLITRARVRQGARMVPGFLLSRMGETPTSETVSPVRPDPTTETTEEVSDSRESPTGESESQIRESQIRDSKVSQMRVEGPTGETPYTIGRTKKSQEEQRTREDARAPAIPGSMITSILEALRDAMRELPGVRGLDPSAPGNRKAIRAFVKREQQIERLGVQGTLDEWRLVIRRQLENVRHDPGLHGFLSVPTLTRVNGGTYYRRLQEGDTSKGRRRSWAPSMRHSSTTEPKANPTNDRKQPAQADLSFEGHRDPAGFDEGTDDIPW